MTKDTHTKLARTISIASAGSLILFAGLASGCSRADDAKTAVNQASRSFGTIAAGDSTATKTHSAKTYRETEALVTEFAGSESGYQEAAAITVSLAKLGQASLASSDASAAELASLHKGRVIRGMINEWLTMSAIAQAAGEFDASAELAEITNLISMRKDDVNTYTSQRTTIDTQIAELDAQIAELRSKSGDERNTAGGLELEMPRVSATKAAEIAVRVREHTLRADGYELEAIRIAGMVGQLRPGAREISLNVDKATSQIALLEESRDEAHERERASKQDARQARDAASAATSRINDAVAEYTEHRSSTVQSANNSAISMVRSSIAALRDAKDATKQVASLSKAAAQQTMAECLSRQSLGYGEAAILYNALNEAGIPGDWTSLAQTALDEQSQIKGSADEAYQAAASSLRNARIRGDEAEKIEATAVRLDQLGGVEPEPEFDDSYDEDEYIDDEIVDEESEEDFED